MAMTWTDIADVAVRAGAALKTGLFTALRGNDRAGSSKPIRIPLSYTGTPTTDYGTVAFAWEYIPEDAAVLRVRAALYAASGTVTVRMTMGGVSVEQTSTATAKGVPGGSADKTWTITGLDALRGTEAELFVEMKHSAGGVSCTLDSSGWPPARFAVE